MTQGKSQITSSSMFKSIKAGLKLKVEKKSKELAALQQRVDDMNDPEKSSMMEGI